jgi:hypothetical protein
MLTDEDLKAIATLLEAYGLKKPPSAAALRQQRYRERKKASVTGHNETVTASGLKRNAPSQKRNGAHNASVPDETPVFVSVPLNDGTEFGVTQKLVKEFEGLYPAVDVPQTLREIRGWNLTRPGQRKTRGGILKHINGWLAKEQNKG